jgi:hypothetical protein
VKIVVMAHVWDASGFLRKTGVTQLLTTHGVGTLPPAVGTRRRCRVWRHQTRRSGPGTARLEANESGEGAVGAWRSRLRQGFFPDRTGRTAAVRYRYTGPVQPGTAQNRVNSNSKSKSVVHSVWSGIPNGSTGIPVRFDREPVVETKKPN